MKNIDMTTVGGVMVLAGITVTALGVVFLAYKGMEWLVELSTRHGAAWGLVAIAGGAILYLVGGVVYWAGGKAAERRRSTDA
jgi:hypothetical protein